MSVQKKRESALKAKPVVHKGVRYEAVLWSEPTWGSDPLPDVASAFVVAMKAEDGSELWRAKLYDIRYDGDMERDKQDIYVKKLSLSFGRDKLKAVDEKERRYVVDLKTHAVDAR